MSVENIVLLVASAFVLYFFMIRPQQKRTKEMKKFREELSKGSKIVTSGGIHGKVVEVKGNDTVLIESNGTKFIVDKQAISAAFDPLEKK